MGAALTHHDLSITRRKHRERVEYPRFPEIEGELAEAYHQLQLHWLRSVPGYRQAVKDKLHAAAKHADRQAMRIERHQQTLHGGTLAQALRDDQLQRLAGY